MNASVDAMNMDIGQPRTPRPAPHATHTYKLLLKREFWEHKGGFFWAPLCAGAASLLMTLMALLVGEVAARRAVATGKMQVDGDVKVNGLDLSALSRHFDAGDLRHLADGVDLSTLMASVWPLIVLAFVVFFYCLGSLYDERKDRSVLFWKSLPVSDRDTVLSKALSALLLAPALATAVSIACMFCFLLLISAFVLLHNGNPLDLVWGPGSPLELAGLMVAMLPIYALWALPTVGWLLLCSAWAKSKPFLWAIMLPVFAGIFVSWFDVMQVFNLESGWFWQNIVARGLLSAVPGTWIDVAHLDGVKFTGPDQLTSLVALKATYSTLLAPQLWIGAVAGAAMIYSAMRMRRWRDEG